MIYQLLLNWGVLLSGSHNYNLKRFLSLVRQDGSFVFALIGIATLKGNRLHFSTHAFLAALAVSSKDYFL